MRARVINICQYEKNPRTGESLNFNESNILSAISHKTIKQYGYGLHDKDVYTEEEEKHCIEALDAEYERNHPNETKEEYIKANQWVHIGEPKPPHWHVVCRCNSAVELSVFSSWFGVPEQYIDVPKGRGAFLDCIQYLTHERPEQIAQGKYRYPDEEIHANFDFRAELDRMMLNRSKYGGDVDLKTEIRLKVMYGELTLKQVKANYPIIYTKDSDTLRKLRLEFIQEEDPPTTRYNFYICGGGGVGKGASSTLLARVLYPDYESDDERLFRVGASGSTFEGYDGQPVIIWDDCRAQDLLSKLGNRGNVFNVFDTFPHKMRQNVKFGAVNLTNAVNIVNSVQPYDEFLNKLVGEYKDKDGVLHESEIAERSQSLRRFPFIIPLRADDFDILINLAYMTGGTNFDDYIMYKNLRGNFGKLIKALPEDSVMLKNITTSMVRPLLEARDKKEQEQIEKQTKEIDISEFESYGKPIEKSDLSDLEEKENKK